MFNRRPGIRSSDYLPPMESHKEEGPPQNSGIHSRIVGTTFAPNAQAVLAQFSRNGREAFEGDSPRFSLFLRPEPSNVHDADAIEVCVRSNVNGREQQLGHIQNSARRCPACGAEYEKVRKSADAKTLCERCGTELVRSGLASTLCQRARSAGVDVDKLYSVSIDWDSGGITGGKDQKGGRQQSWGCNILITKKDK